MLVSIIIQVSALPRRQGWQGFTSLLFFRRNPTLSPKIASLWRQSKHKLCQNTGMKIISTESVFDLSRKQVEFSSCITLQSDRLISPKGWYKGHKVALFIWILSNVRAALYSIHSRSVVKTTENTARSQHKQDSLSAKAVKVVKFLQVLQWLKNWSPNPRKSHNHICCVSWHSVEMWGDWWLVPLIYG